VNRGGGHGSVREGSTHVTRGVVAMVMVAAMAASRDEARYAGARLSLS